MSQDGRKRGTAAARCPICRAQATPTDNAAFPFCSERCRTIDLGNWLGESYRIPVDEAPDADAGPDEE